MEFPQHCWAKKKSQWSPVKKLCGKCPLCTKPFALRLGAEADKSYNSFACAACVKHMSMTLGAKRSFAAINFRIYRQCSQCLHMIQEGLPQYGEQPQHKQQYRQDSTTHQYTDIALLLLLSVSAGSLSDVAYLRTGEHLCSACKVLEVDKDLLDLTAEDVFGVPPAAVAAPTGGETPAGSAPAASLTASVAPGAAAAAALAAQSLLSTPSAGAGTSKGPTLPLGTSREGGVPGNGSLKRPSGLAFVDSVKEIAKQARAGGSSSQVSRTRGSLASELL
jgi:hypothetical protein